MDCQRTGGRIRVGEMTVLAEMTIQGWRPGPGDPSLGGWIVFFSYWVAAAGAFLAARAEKKVAMLPGQDRWVGFWWWVGLALVGLAINKELDLHNAITWFGRNLARQTGWYNQRRQAQMVFILGVVAVALGFVAWSIQKVGSRRRDYLFPLVGLQLLVAFIVVRAASFHHVDIFLRRHLGEFKLHAVAEFAAIAWIGASAFRAYARDRAILGRVAVNAWGQRP